MINIVLFVFLLNYSSVAKNMWEYGKLALRKFLCLWNSQSRKILLGTSKLQ